MNKQNERIAALQTTTEQLQNKREEMKNVALEVNYSSNENRNFLSFQIKQQFDKLKQELAEIELQTKDIDPE